MLLFLYWKPVCNELFRFDSQEKIGQVIFYGEQESPKYHTLPASRLQVMHFPNQYFQLTPKTKLY